MKEIEYSNTLLPGNKNVGFVRITPDVQREEEKPSFLETGKAAFRQFNDINRGVSWLIDKTSLPYREQREEDFNPIKEGLLENVPEKYWSNVLEATSRQEAQLVISNINQELEDRRTLERSGFIANLVTTLGATFISPTSIIPVSQTIKYAQIGKGAFVNAVNTAKFMAPSFALQNAVLTGTKETEGLNEWVHDTLVDTFVASSIGGALGAFAAKAETKNLSLVKGFFKAVEDDVGIKLKLGKNGESKGLLAYPTHAGVGAEHVQNVQSLLDEGVSFKDNALIRKFFGFAQPIIEGITNKSPLIRELTDSLLAHNFTTAAGFEKSIKDPSAENFQRFWRSTYGSLQIQTKENWLKYLGIGGVGKSLRGATGEWTGKWASQQEFGEWVSQAIRRNGEHDIPEVATVAKEWINQLYDPLWEQLKQRNPHLQDKNFTNISRYLNRSYNKGLIQEKPDAFMTDIEKFLSESNDKILSYKKPINDLKEEIKGFRSQLKELKVSPKMLTEEERKKFSVRREEAKSAIEDRKLKIKELETKLQKDIEEDKVGLDLLDEVPSYSKEQKEAVLKASKPLEEAKINLKAAKKSKNKENIAKAEEELKIAQKATTDMLTSLDPTFARSIITQSGKFIDVSGKPKLRPILSPEDIKITSRSVMDTILQENEEQIVGKIFDSINAGGTNPLKSRTLLWNDKDAEKWLVNDINVLGGLYMDQLSKRIHIDDVLQKYGTSSREGMKDIVSQLKKEYDLAKDKILEKEESKERAKELNNLKDDFTKNEKFLNNLYKTYMGNYVDRSTKVARASNSIRQFTAATLLGNVPILQLTEFFAPMFKFMFNEYVFDGLVPTLKRMMATTQQTLSENFGGRINLLRGAFQDAGLGNNMALASRFESLFGYGTQYQPRTVLERYVQNLSNISSNVSLSNAISDFQETACAFTSQSKTIRTLKRYLDGKKLTRQEIDRLDLLRLNPEQYAKKIVEQFEKHGEEVDGAFVANFHKWDKAAFKERQIFSIGIEKEVRSIITKPNLGDIPFGFRDPVISLMTQFLSWTFAATQNYALPLLTSPDKQKFVGIALMMASGSLVDPLRQLAKGEEVDLSFKALSVGAMTNSGVFGWPYDALQKLNSAIDIPYLRDLQPDRFKRKSAWQLVGGPALGLADSIFSVTSALVNGEMNQNDARKATSLLIPFSGSWFLRKPMNDAIKGTGLPEDRYQAKRLKETD